VTLLDLFGQTRFIFARTFDFMIYVYAAIIYLVIVEAIRRIWDLIERSCSRHLVIAETQASRGQDEGRISRLGVMGSPMAGHLKAKGHEVTVYNRSAAKAEAWVKKHGGASAKTPREAAKGCDIVFACVGNDDDVRAVTTGGDGAFSGMAKGAVFVDHTTASA